MIVSVKETAKGFPSRTLARAGVNWLGPQADGMIVHRNPLFVCRSQVKKYVQNINLNTIPTRRLFKVDLALLVRILHTSLQLNFKPRCWRLRICLNRIFRRSQYATLFACERCETSTTYCRKLATTLSKHLGTCTR